MEQTDVAFYFPWPQPSNVQQQERQELVQEATSAFKHTDQWCQWKANRDGLYERMQCHMHDFAQELLQKTRKSTNVFENFQF